MIRKLRGEFIAECTDCSVEFPGGTQDDFRAFVDELKAADWTIKNNGGDWEHLCPDCSEEMQ